VRFRVSTIIISAVGAMALAVPALASADSGAISGIGMLGEDRVQATFTVTGDPCSSGFCGFFGFARSVGPNDLCGPDAGRPVWVQQGGINTTSGTVTQTGNWPVLDRTPFKLCLYSSHGTAQNILVAEAPYDPPEKAAAPPVVPAPTPTPTPAPAPTTAAPTAPAANTGATQQCKYWSAQETKRGKAYKAAKNAYRKKRTAARKRAMKIALDKLRTAERKALSACG
jgi:hypothetical protein